MWTEGKNQSAFELRVNGEKLHELKLFPAIWCFLLLGEQPPLGSLHERRLIPALSFSSLGPNLQSPNLQLTALIRKWRNKKTVCKPDIKGVPPLHYIYTCFTLCIKGVTLL